MKRKFGFGLLLVLTLLFTQLSTALADDKPGYGTNEKHDKYTLWGDQFWEYAVTLPSGDDFAQFLYSTSGECVHTNQTYDVFFLGGYGGSGAVNRTCTVQAGTRLFFPLVNTVWGEEPKYYDPKASPSYGPKTFTGWFDKYFSRSNVAGLFTTIDGKSLIKAGDLEDLYVSTKLGNAPIINWFGVINYQTFNGGYYLSVKLPPRTKPYTLHFGGQVTGAKTFSTTFSPKSQWVKDNLPNPYIVEFPTITQDITYTITVKA